MAPGLVHFQRAYTPAISPEGLIGTGEIGCDRVIAKRHIDCVWQFCMSCGAVIGGRSRNRNPIHFEVTAPGTPAGLTSAFKVTDAPTLPLTLLTVVVVGGGRLISHMPRPNVAAAKTPSVVSN